MRRLRADLEVVALGAFGADFADELLEGGSGVRELRDVVEQRPICHIPILQSTGLRATGVKYAEGQ